MHDEHARASADTPKLIAAWLFVSLPFAWGVYVTLHNVVALFH